MKDAEELLNDRRSEIDKLEVPEDMEMRLHSALKNRTLKPRASHSWRLKAAALLIGIILVGYNFDTLAYYGKKLIGYDAIMNGTLKQLNELGKGQEIGKSYTLKNGIILTLDGAMLDENQFLIFYSLKDSRGDIDKADLGPFISIKGTFGDYLMESSYGKINDKKTEIKYITNFKVPSFFEKKLSFKFSVTKGDYKEEGEIKFTLDRNKAMGHTMKKVLNTNIKVDETKVHFESITASPTSTVIKGKMQNIIELAIDQIRGERFRPGEFDVRLIANGKMIPSLGGEVGTNMDGITFKNEYDALPSNLEKLQVKLVSFGADHDVHKQIKLKKNINNPPIKILGQNVEINKVYESEGNTCITITTEKSVVLTRVYLIADSKRVELQKTISSIENKKTDGTITHTRTMVFPGNGSNLQLDVQRITYEKIYNQIIDVPIN